MDAPAAAATPRNLISLAEAENFSLWLYRDLNVSWVDVLMDGFFDPVGDLLLSLDEIHAQTKDGALILLVRRDRTRGVSVQQLAATYGLDGA